MIVESRNKNHKEKGEMTIFLKFLDPSSPRLASGLPGPPNDFMVKKTTCLGELQLTWASSSYVMLLPQCRYAIASIVFPILVFLFPFLTTKSSHPSS